ncbi:MAG: carboxymuconolactone decarboxylase family protein [Nitrospiraceae bacterium]|nr:MAG: carboxymuconolactone decarboxylase family protein [Nitrospiraceae bacterium]
MGILDVIKKLLVSDSDDSGTEVEVEMAEEKKMTAEEANEYMQKVMGFVPRMFKIVNTVTPDPGRTFADFYATIFGDGALSKKVKELMFTAIGVSYCSPRCIIHVIPAINAGATTGEIFEAVSVGMIGAGFVPGGPGIPYAFEYALKCLDIEAKFRKGEEWEYLPQPKFDRGIY